MRNNVEVSVVSLWTLMPPLPLLPFRGCVRPVVDVYAHAKKLAHFAGVCRFFRGCHFSVLFKVFMCPRPAIFFWLGFAPRRGQDGTHQGTARLFTVPGLCVPVQAFTVVSLLSR